MGNNQLLQPPPSQPPVNRPKYGPFLGVAEIEQKLKTTLREAPTWNNLSPDQKAALEMIVHKIARIVNGDPSYTDSWHDIAGYANLVENRLLGTGPV